MNTSLPTWQWEIAFWNASAHHRDDRLHPYITNLCCMTMNAVQGGCIPTLVAILSASETLPSIFKTKASTYNNQQILPLVTQRAVKSKPPPAASHNSHNWLKQWTELQLSVTYLCQSIQHTCCAPSLWQTQPQAHRRHVPKATYMRSLLTSRKLHQQQRC